MAKEPDESEAAENKDLSDLKPDSLFRDDEKITILENNDSKLENNNLDSRKDKICSPIDKELEF